MPVFDQYYKTVSSLHSTKHSKNQAFLRDLVSKIAQDMDPQGRGVLVLPKTGKAVKNRVPPPELRRQGKLSQKDQWRSLLWMIDTAQVHGPNALRTLSVALARIIQVDAFKSLFFDARPHHSSDGSVDDLLWGEETAITKDGRRLGDLLIRRRGRDEINLGRAVVIAKIWEPWRLARAFQCLGRGSTWGPWKQNHNHRAFSWHPWPLVWVYNGNHSSTAANLKGGGILRCEASYDAAPLLALVRTDGVRWFGENGMVLGSVHSLPMAGIMEIGRRLLDLRSGGND